MSASSCRWSPKTPLKQRSPSYQRRNARRRAMRANEDIHTEGDLVLDSCTDDAVKASTVEVANETLNKTVKSVHVEKDKVVENVIIYAVPPSDCRKRIQNTSEVEIEVREKFASIGVEVRDMKLKCSKTGTFESSMVKISPTILRKIWGRRLDLKNYALIELKQPSYFGYSVCTPPIA